MIRKSHFCFVALCALAGLGLTACDDDNSSPSKCSTVKDCPNPETQLCKAFKCVDNPCTNKTKDDDETDVDCGGNSSCGKCETGKKCEKAEDCATNYCDEEKKCAVQKCEPGKTNCPGGSCDPTTLECVSCSDSTKNGDETDVDCGGPTCTNKCKEGQGCKENSDCESASCSGDKCAPAAGAIDINSLVINEVMGAPKNGNVFAINGGAKQCEFIEIVNTSDQPGSLDGITLLLERTDKDDPKDVALEGSIMAKGVHVVHNCTEGLPLPSDATAGKLKSSALVNSVPYKITLKKDSGSSKVFEMPAKSLDGVSYNHSTEGDANSSVIDHTQMTGSQADASPGYCANGGQFSTGCVAQTIKCASPSDAEADCGATCSTKCPAGKTCNTPADCATKNCDTDEHTCIAEQEGCVPSDADAGCGGTCDEKCEIGQKCTKKDDCKSGKCTSKQCAEAAATCTPSDETAQCGGTCEKCGIDKTCNQPSDCLSNNCNTTSHKCEATCTPSDPDNNCGGDCQDKCGDQMKCSAPADCVSNICSGDKCSGGNVACNASDVENECGGTCKHKCEDGQICEQGSDCKSGVCESAGTGWKCVACSPSDADAKCGGNCINVPCEIGNTCTKNADCKSNMCDTENTHKCIYKTAEVDKVIINEVMANPDTNANFAIQEETKQCEFIELVNLDPEPVMLDGFELKLFKGTGKAMETTPAKTYSLSSMSIKASGALVLVESSCATAELPMPEDAEYKQQLASSLTNDKDYTIRLYKGADIASEAELIANSKGISHNRSKDKGTTKKLVLHNTLAPLNINNSPGYCANKAMFSKNCQLD